MSVHKTYRLYCCDRIKLYLRCLILKTRYSDTIILQYTESQPLFRFICICVLITLIEVLQITLANSFPLREIRPHQCFIFIILWYDSKYVKNLRYTINVIFSSIFLLRMAIPHLIGNIRKLNYYCFHTLQLFSQFRFQIYTYIYVNKVRGKYIINYTIKLHQSYLICIIYHFLYNNYVYDFWFNLEPVILILKIYLVDII